MIAKDINKRQCAWTNYRTGEVCGYQVEYHRKCLYGLREQYCAMHYKMVKKMVEGIIAGEERKHK